MNFLAKVRDLPSPLKLNIKYMDRMSQKKRDLQIAVSFGTCKHDDDGGHHHGHGHGHGHGEKGGNRFPRGPNFIMIESKGGGQSISKATKTTSAQMTVE